MSETSRGEIPGPSHALNGVQAGMPPASGLLTDAGLAGVHTTGPSAEA
jgi:hypothetical protein